MERELWKALYVLAIELDKPWGSWRYSTADVLGAYFWAVVYDRPTAWASDPAQWPDELHPALLPPQNTLSRRLRQAEIGRASCRERVQVTVRAVPVKKNEGL